MTGLQKAFTSIVLTFLAISLLATTLSVQSPRYLFGHLEVFASTPVPSTAIPTPTPTLTPSCFEPRIDQLESRLGDLGALVEVQSNVFEAAVSRMEANLNLLLTILAIVSLLTAILGYGIVRVWIRSLVENRLKDITSQEISRVVQEEVDRIRKEWDPKFAQLYDEMRRSMRR